MEALTLTSFEKALAVKKLKRVPCGTAGVVLGPHNEILMIKRKGAHGEGTWSVPGGWVEAGEHPQDTINRELWEEVGVTPLVLGFMGYTFDRHPEGIEDVCLWFVSSTWEGAPRVGHPDKVEEIGWFTFDELPFPLFVPLAEAIKEGFLNDLRSK